MTTNTFLPCPKLNKNSKDSWRFWIVDAWEHFNAIPSAAPIGETENKPLSIYSLHAEVSTGALIGYEIVSNVSNVKTRENWVAAWIPEFTALIETRLKNPFPMILRLQGLLVFEHPLGCSFVVNSNVPKPIVELFGG